MKYKLLLLTLLLMGCSKDALNEIPTPIGGEPTAQNPYELFSINYTNNSILNRIPILFKNVKELEFKWDENKYPADIAILDYNNDGYYDFVGGGSNFDASYAGVEERNPFIFYTGDEEGNLTYDSINSQKFTSLIHGTFAVVNDFNQDGNLDIFFVGSGFERPDSPCCEYPILLESDGNGSFVQKNFEEVFGYWFNVTTGDVNNNGIIDIKFTSPKPFDGTPSYLIEFIGGIYTIIEWNDDLDYSHTFDKLSTEIIDLDNDGKDDIIYGGREYNNSSFHQNTWSTSFIKFSDNHISLLPVKGYETTDVSDIQVNDIDNDGDLDLFLLRTDWTIPGNVKNYIQVIRNDERTFVDITETNVLGYLDGTGSQIARIIITDSNSDGIYELRNHTLSPVNFPFTDFKFEIIGGKLIKK